MERRRSKRIIVTASAKQQTATEKPAEQKAPETQPKEQVSETLNPSVHENPENAVLTKDESLVGEQAHLEHAERRLSSRAIRRKKFDDELIDESSTYGKRSLKLRIPSESRELTNEVFETTSETPSSSQTHQILQVSESETQATPEPQPKRPRKASKQAQVVEATETQPSTETNTSRDDSTVADWVSVSTDCIEDEVQIPFKPASERTIPELSEFRDHQIFWTPQDDLALLLNMTHCGSIEKIHQKVEFSRKFNLQDVAERWGHLLLEKAISDISIESIRQLHPSIVANIQNRILFNEKEEEVLKKIPSNVWLDINCFQKLLSKYSDVFPAYRRPQDLFAHYCVLRRNLALNDQKELPYDEKPHLYASADNSTTQVMSPLSSCSKAQLEEKVQELQSLISISTAQIRILEEEVKLSQTLLGLNAGITNMEFGSDVYAYLRGRHTRFLIKSTEVTLGRASKDIPIDCDLTMESYSGKISRLAAVINLLPMGKFLIFNCGSNPFKVNAKTVHPDEAAELYDYSLFEIDKLSFIFRINRSLVNKELNLRRDVPCVAAASNKPAANASSDERAKSI